MVNNGAHPIGSALCLASGRVPAQQPLHRANSVRHREPAPTTIVYTMDKVPNGQPFGTKPRNASSQASRAFVARVGTIGVPTLLQTIASTGKPAVITIRHDGETSRLWLADGNVIDAESGALRAESAAYRILSLQDGELISDFSYVQRSRTISASLQHLLLQSAVRQDDERKLYEEITGLGSVYELTSDAPDIAVGQNTAETRVLGALNGKRTVDEVLEQERTLERLDLLQAWAELRDRGWVQPATQQPTQLARPAGQASKGQGHVSVVRPIPVDPLGQMDEELEENGLDMTIVAPSPLDDDASDSDLDLDLELEEEATTLTPATSGLPKGIQPPSAGPPPPTETMPPTAPEAAQTATPQPWEPEVENPEVRSLAPQPPMDQVLAKPLGNTRPGSTLVDWPSQTEPEIPTRKRAPLLLGLLIIPCILGAWYTYHLLNADSDAGQEQAPDESDSANSQATGTAPPNRSARRPNVGP